MLLEIHSQQPKPRINVFERTIELFKIFLNSFNWFIRQYIALDILLFYLISHFISRLIDFNRCLTLIWLSCHRLFRGSSWACLTIVCFTANCSIKLDHIVSHKRPCSWPFLLAWVVLLWFVTIFLYHYLLSFVRFLFYVNWLYQICIHSWICVIYFWPRICIWSTSSWLIDYSFLHLWLCICLHFINFRNSFCFIFYICPKLLL